MRILVIGQCSLHKGRLENGNIGNYYISETTFRELHRVFPEAEIVTTFQFSDTFCLREKVSCIPLECYYNWDENDLSNAIYEYGIAKLYSITGKVYQSTRYIDEICKSDLIIDFSGELWGDHAEPVGHDRFLVGLLKDRVAQLFNKKTVLLASSEGPFSDSQVLPFAKEVYKNFDMICNREATSKILLETYGFDVSKTYSYACPAFLFEPTPLSNTLEIIERDRIFSTTKPNVGFILCGFNFEEGPYDKTPRGDEEFTKFVELIEYIANELKAHIILMSHQNGFEKNPFKLINGRDYPIAKQLYELVRKRGQICMDDIILPVNPYTPKETKGIISQLDMLITGRVHGFVAGVSSFVPTVLINRGFGGISHRNIGFARVVNMEDFISDPHSVEDMKRKVLMCFHDREEIKTNLIKIIPNVQNTAREAFETLKILTNGN